MSRAWKSQRSRHGFSLIELLVVMAIIIMLMALVVPASTSMMAASRLTTAASSVSGLLSYARQNAIASNHTMEVRFYRYGDPEVPGEKANDPTTGRFRAVQLFEYQENGVARAVTKAEPLPGGIIFDAGTEDPKTTLSSLFGKQHEKQFTPAGGSGAPQLDPKVNLPRGVGTNYDCMAFQFSPSGITNLGFGNWFVTLHKANDGDNLGQPPPNYATLQVEPVSGAVKTYRP